MKTLTRVAFVVALAASFVGVANATDIPWTGANGTTWGDEFNWTGGVPGATDNAVFSGTFANQPTLIADTGDTGGIWITGEPGQDTIISGAFALNLTGNTINSILGLGVLLDSTTPFVATISANPVLHAAQTWQNSSGNLLTVSGATTTNGHTLTLANTSTGGTTISGIISGAGGKLLKTGAGTLVLSGANTFDGGLTISGGTVSMNNNAAAGTSTGTLTLNGGTLINNAATRTISNPIHVEASTTNAIYAIGGNITLTGALSGSGTIGNAGDAAADRRSIVVSGDLSGFTGTVEIHRAELRDSFAFQAPAATPGSNDASGARFVLNVPSERTPFGFLNGAEGRLNLVRRTSTDNNIVTFKIGELSGNGGRIQDDFNAAGSASGGSLTLEVGHLGTDAEWGGAYGLSSVAEGPIANFTKVGSGSLTLGGHNEYNGVTSVNEGTLLVNGNHFTGDAYTVASGATLGGTGRISANVVVQGGGILAPGASIGTLTVGGAEISGTLRIEGAGSLIDKLMVGTVVLPGDGDFNNDGFVDAADYVVWRKDPGSFDGDFGYAVWRMNFGDSESFTGGDLNIDNATLDLTSLGSLNAGTHVIAEYGSLVGTFGGGVTGLPGGFTINYAFEGNKIALVSAASAEGFGSAVVPEPGSIFLAVVGGLLMAYRRRAGRKHA
ncbi:MAG: autotransporter-associated beta strand repeat-containing protein [Pirellulales bacterium]